jgi:hypothetical protein
MLPIIERLHARGHQVVFAMPNLALAELVESRGGKCVACPAFDGRTANEIYPTENYAQVLHNCGFGDQEVLGALVRGWLALFDEVRPDFVLCDHSPRALLAMRATTAPATRARELPERHRGRLLQSACWPATIRCATMGIGFCCPPASAFESLLLEDRPVSDDRGDEARILANANSVLAAHDGKPLSRMAELFEDVDECFLMTYPELDHFPRRSAPKYHGCVGVRLGDGVEWPESSYPKVFIYTRQFPALGELLRYIGRSELSALVYSEDAMARVSELPGRGRIRYLDRPFDLEHVAATCDLAITNGNHGTTAAMLLAGKPVLVVPTVAEQYMLGQRVEALGAGVLARPDDADAIVGGLHRLLRDRSTTDGARRFRVKYARRTSEGVVEEIVSGIERRT